MRYFNRHRTSQFRVESQVDAAESTFAKKLANLESPDSSGNDGWMRGGAFALLSTDHGLGYCVRGEKGCAGVRTVVRRIGLRHRGFRRECRCDWSGGILIHLREIAKYVRVTRPKATHLLHNPQQTSILSPASVSADSACCHDTEPHAHDESNRDAESSNEKQHNETRVDFVILEDRPRNTADQHCQQCAADSASQVHPHNLCVGLREIGPQVCGDGTEIAVERVFSNEEGKEGNANWEWGDGCQPDDVSCRGCQQAEPRGKRADPGGRCSHNADG